MARVRRLFPVLALFLGVFMCVALARPAQAGLAERRAHLVIGPYVTGVSASSAGVMWVSEPSAPAGRVRVRAGGRSFEVPSMAHPIPGRAEVLCTARLCGLSPSTRYLYRLPSARGELTGSFVTPPVEPAALRFVIYGDTRSRPDQHHRVAAAIARENPAFVICTGDLVTNGQEWDLWRREFFGPASPYLRKAAIWPVRGNHEGDAVFMRALFGLAASEGHYSFDAGDAHFAVLDNYAPEGQALDWLEGDLARSRAGWTFVTYHEPTFNVGGHGSTWGQQDVLPLLERAGVDFVITGHSHLYERFLPIGPAGKKPIIHIVTGGGGAPLYAAEPSPILVGGVGRPELHYCLFEIRGSSCELTVKRPDGSVVDRLSLIKREGAYQSELMAEAVETETAKALALAFTELKADMPAVPLPGQEVRATLTGGRLPPGCSLVVRQAAGKGAWAVRAQSVTPVEGRLECDLRAPARLRAGPEGFRPPLRVTLGIEYQGRSYGLQEVPVSPSDATVRRIIPPPAAVEIAYAARPVAVDADLSEWAAVPAMPLPFHKKGSSSFRLAWREEGLYGAVSVRDGSIRANAAAPWTADAVELFIEKDFTRSVERGPNAAQYILSPAPESGPGPAHVMIAHDPGGADKAGVACAWQPTPKGYVLEFLIPAARLEPAKMEPGCVLGLNFALDNDGRPVEQFYSDKDPIGWRMPVTWGAIRLSR